MPAAVLRAALTFPTTRISADRQVKHFRLQHVGRDLSVDLWVRVVAAY
jgi:hypothetical protein